MLARSKLNSIETLISQALIDLKSSQEEFRIIVNEKEKHKETKESIRNIKISKLRKLKKDIFLFLLFYFIFLFFIFFAYIK